MSPHDVPPVPRQSPKAHLLFLPTEIIQSIYLSCLSPHLPHASPVLTSALSTELIYKFTFLDAFWNPKPLVFAGTQTQQPYEPGPHALSLFQPLAVPRGEQDNDDTRAQRMELQKTVLAYRWCTFQRAKLYFSSAIEAMTRDLFSTLNIPLSSHDQTRLDSFIAQYLPASRSTFEATALDGSHVSLEYPRRLATAILMTYHGPDPRFDQSSSPNLTIRPTDVLSIPSHVLTGQLEWTRENMDFLQMLCSYVNLRTIQYELSAFHKGMENAIVQGNYEALLLLLWQADRLAEYKDATSHDEMPFEPPAELFRLVARRHGGRLGLVDSDGAGSEVADNDSSVDISLFTLLIRAHAESMPQYDSDITTWARYLLTCRDSSTADRVRKFAQLVLDWGGMERCSEYIVDRYTLRRGEHRKVRRPLFRGGSISRRRKGDEMVMRFVQICGGRVEGFGNELEAIGKARGRES